MVLHTTVPYVEVIIIVSIIFVLAIYQQFNKKKSFKKLYLDYERTSDKIIVKITRVTIPYILIQSLLN